MNRAVLAAVAASLMAMFTALYVWMHQRPETSAPPAAESRIP